MPESRYSRHPGRCGCSQLELGMVKPWIGQVRWGSRGGGLVVVFGR